MGVEVSDAMTPRPSPAGTAVRRPRNSPARAASPAYSATMIWITTKGQNVGLRSVFTADVSTPTATPTLGPASAVASIVPVVSRKSGSATASTAADRAKLIATATGMSASSRTGTASFREGQAKDRYRTRMAATFEPSKIVRALRAAHLHDSSRRDLLQLACTRIRAHGAPYTSVYAYMLHGNELVLEAHAGRDTPHTRIPVGRGVCGTAVATGEDQNVADVAAVGNYLACNLDTKSELVVLIRRGTTILGQIDVDSDVPAGFTDAHHHAVKEVADALAVLL
ncbi:MAG: hypothetical protein DMD31_09700 [Gemmatimonadetes bacterium]|nr:MAG: hypothetical protein DMD31_09700 [Gemmatimonadota bacterium]